MKKKTEEKAVVMNRVFCVNAGNSLNDKSGKNMNKAGNNDKEPILKAAAISPAKAKPAKLSREKTEKQLSLKAFFKAIEFRNSKKQMIPAKAEIAATGLGK